ncbi:MAG: phage protease, partial [Terriglobia bacterium]
MAEQDYATVSGEKVHRSDFAYAPAGSEPSEWKLPIHDASHVRNALARFNQTELPEGAKAAVHAKIMRAARKFGIDTKEGNRQQGTGSRSKRRAEPLDLSLVSHLSSLSLAVLLTGAGTAVETPAGIALHGPGTQLREIAIAVPGSWVKGDHSFSISKDDMSDMARNFDKRKNSMIPIDYEHASEMPEVAKGGAVPAAGWIHALRLGNREQGTGNGSNHEPRTTNHCLQALVEWTPQAEEMLRTGQYRFFSPAIDWGAKDKETGEPQGATLTSGALTNHPFLEELPPIMLSDGTLIKSGEPGLGIRDSGLGNDARLRRATSPKTEHRTPNPEKKGAITMAEEKSVGAPLAAPSPEEDLAETTEQKDGKGEPASAGGHELPMLKIRKGRKGSKHEGHHILSDGAGDVGCMSDEDFEQHAAKRLGVNPDENRDERQEARDEKETARE